jgi:hypothetical protein
MVEHDDERADEGCQTTEETGEGISQCIIYQVGVVDEVGEKFPPFVFMDVFQF